MKLEKINGWYYNVHCPRCKMWAMRSTSAVCMCGTPYISEAHPQQDPLKLQACRMMDRAAERARDVHVVPVFDGEPKHEESENCWCEPECIEVNEETGVKVWSHRRPE